MTSNDERKTNALQSQISCNWISLCLVNLRSHILVGMSFMGKVSRETAKQRTEASLVLSHVQEAHLSVEQFVPVSLYHVHHKDSQRFIFSITDRNILPNVDMLFLCVFLVNMNMYIVRCLNWNAFTGLQSHVCLASLAVSYPFCNAAELLPTLSEETARCFAFPLTSVLSVLFAVVF